jgi:hypothetical protein
LRRQRVTATSFARSTVAGAGAGICTPHIIVPRGAIAERAGRELGGDSMPSCSTNMSTAAARGHRSRHTVASPPTASIGRAVLETLERRRLMAEAVIDFDDLPQLTVVTNQYPEATFSGDPAFPNMVIPSTDGSQPNSIGAPTNGGNPFNHPLYVDFTSPANNLRFLQIRDDASAGTVIAQVRVFTNGNLTATVPIQSTGQTFTPGEVNLSAYQNVTRIEIVNVTDPAGILYDDFFFTYDDKPRIALSSATPADSQQRLWIDEESNMPAVTVELAGLPADAPADLVVTWTVSLKLPAGASPGGKAVGLPVITSNQVGKSYTIPFPQVAGGELDITAQFKIGDKNYTLSTETENATKNLKILARNPDKAAIQAFIDSLPVPSNWPTGSSYDYHTILRKFAAHETSGFGGYHQFRTTGAHEGYPLWNTGGDGGVGIMQVTRSLPVLAEVWDWRANVRAGVAIFSDKLRIAQTYSTSYDERKQFEKAVKEFNKARHKAKKGKPDDITITVPEWTADQKVLVAIRAYNGAAGTDSLGVNILHEYELKVTASGLLDVTVDETTKTGTVQWVRVPIDRRSVGEPNYVELLLAAPSA